MNMETKVIPTAEEYLHKKILKYVKQRKEIPKEYHKSVAETLSGKIHEENYYAKAMIEFAQLHVKAALKAANKKRKKQDWIDNHINLKEHACTKAILNAYPKENIK